MTKEEYLKKFYKHCGIDDLKVHQIRNIGFEEVGPAHVNYISVKIYRKNIDYWDEFLFGPQSSLYDFLLDYFHLVTD